MNNLRNLSGLGQSAPNVSTPKSSRGKKLGEDKMDSKEDVESKKKEMNRVRKRLSVVSSSTLADGVQDLDLAEEKV